MLETKNFDAFFDKEENRETSLIYKQIKKMPIDFWKDKMNKYLEFVLFGKDTTQIITFLTKFKDFANSDFINKLSKMDDFNEYFNDDFYNIYNEEDKSYLLKECIYFTTTSGIGPIFQDFNAIFLDIYYVLRTFKGEKHVLSIGYFGNNHVKNLTHFFTNILEAYTLTNQIIRTDDTKRCLDFSNEKINLDEIISKHV